MYKEYLNVILTDNVQSNVVSFRDIFNDLKISVKTQVKESYEELEDYLGKDGNIIPDILFLNFDCLNKHRLELVNQWRWHPRMDNMTIAVFAEALSDSEIEDLYVNGVNIYIKKPADYNDLKKVISEVVMINWQYYTSGLNKSNFIMKV
ncbi:response regulator [Chryseobacterium sp. CT-SW4]|uniref:response regulator n=1 Tax=Chryseobacterium sp. SW-1 TaxID=3157343 RepID=UPI003B01C3F7